jgi:hypothetical protein
MATETLPTNLEEIKDRAVALVERFIGARATDELSEALRPEPSDYDEVFVPEVVEQVRAAYDTLWLETPRPEPKPGQTRVLCWAVPASLLTDDNELSRRFPGGYRRIAHLLVPQRIWLAWKYVTPGASTGMAYDGLVWRGDRFAWFPKPWRVLG